MPLDFSCTSERFTAEITAKEYIANFRRADYFIKLCQQCGRSALWDALLAKNYGKRYGCPPFDDDPLNLLERYQNVWLLGVKIVPNDKDLPLKCARSSSARSYPKGLENNLMSPVIDELNKELLAEEKRLGGYSFGFVGTCPYCGGAPCAREKGKPCRHPDKVRPSLEAFGFDMSKTAKDLLGLEIKWSKDGKIPEYLTLVCGIFY